MLPNFSAASSRRFFYLEKENKMTNLDVKTMTVQAAYDALVKERQEWDAKELLESNRRLYGLLANCYGLAETIAADRGKQKDLDAIVKAKKIVKNSGASLITKVVKLVFSTGRGRTSVYTNVLHIAKYAGVTPDGLSTWLTKQGGIEEVYATKGKAGKQSGNARQERADKGETALDDLPELHRVPKGANTPERVGPVLALGSKNADGTVSFKYFIDQETLVNQALVYLAKKTDEAEEQATADNTDARQAGVDAAVAAVSEAGEDLEQAA